MGIFPLGNSRPCLFHSPHLPTLSAPTMGHHVGENWASWAHRPPPLFGARWRGWGGGPGWQREGGHRAGSGNVFVCVGTRGHVLESVWIVLARIPGAAWSFLVIFQDRKWEWAGIKPAIESIRRKTTLKCGGCWCVLCMECCIPWGEHSSQTGWLGNAVSTGIVPTQGWEGFLFDSEGNSANTCWAAPTLSQVLSWALGRNNSGAFQPCKSSQSNEGGWHVNIRSHMIKWYRCVLGDERRPGRLRLLQVPGSESWCDCPGLLRRGGWAVRPS